MIKVLFVLPSLKAGGAERVVLHLAEYIDREKFEPMLVVLGSEKHNNYVPEKIRPVYLYKHRALAAFPDLIRLVRKYKPDIVFGAIAHVNVMLGMMSLLFPRTKFIGREASVPSVMKQYASRKGLPDWLTGYLYRRLDLIVCQSKDMKEDMISLFSIKPSHCILVNNPITKNTGALANPADGAVKQFVTVGRLSSEKGYDRLLKILSKVPLDFRYKIIGDGPWKEKLEEFIRDYGLQEKVELVGFSPDVFRYLQAAHLYLQGSYVEGFPNALLEAVSIGLPGVAFHVKGGTPEILEHGFNGYLVQTEEAYAEAIVKGIEKNWDRAAIAADTQARFGSERILKQYEDSFLSLKAGK